MEKPNVDDVFDDFEYKVDGKKETSNLKKEDSEEDSIKRKYQEALDRQNKERKKHVFEEKKEDKPGKGLGGYERTSYLVIILLLAAFNFVDLSSFAGDKDNVVEQPITASAVDVEEKSEEPAEEEEVLEEEIVEEEEKLSGKITFTIDKVHTEIVDENGDLGYISKIDFIIENGKEEVLKSIVNVFIYDDKLHESWELRSRGIDINSVGIESGDSYSGTISISPKTFRNLDLKKSIRLSLNDTEEGFVTSINENVYIS